MSTEGGDARPVMVLVPGRNLVLIGLMGAGKTTVGELVAERLGRPFADTDAIIESESGMTIREVFDTRGEREFRGLEAEAVRRVSALRGQVVAVGGGAIADPANRTSLRATGDLVWLDADPHTLAGRVSGGEGVRPMLDGSADVAGRLAELHARRARDYARAAALQVDTTGRSPEEIADTILDWANRRPGLLAREERRA